MKIEMKLDDSLTKRTDWSIEGFNMFREIDASDIYIDFYDGVGVKIATITLFVDSFSAVASLERLSVFDKNIDKVKILELFLDYIYNLENPYFKILGLTCSVEGSGLNDFTLQRVGFFTPPNHKKLYCHLNPNFDESLNLGTSNEEIKNIFRNKYDKYSRWRKEFIEIIQKQLTESKIFLEELETKGDNKIMISAKLQEIEKDEIILNAWEDKGMRR